MKKLALNLDDLAVQSFVVTPGTGPRRGTVVGHQFTGRYEASCVGVGVCSGTYPTGYCPSQGCPVPDTEYPVCEMQD